MEKQGFRLIEHTADTGLEAWGETLAGAYAAAAAGMFSIMVDPDAVRDAETRWLELSEDDPEGLLFEWLNSLLYLFDVESLLFRRFDIVALDDRHLRAACGGERYDPARHNLRTGIKSATYHLLEVDRERNRVRVIFDV